jgi:hypothetical protein
MGIFTISCFTFTTNRRFFMNKPITTHRTDVSNTPLHPFTAETAHNHSLHNTFTHTLAAIFIALCMAFVQQAQAEMATQLVTTINSYGLGGGSGTPLSATTDGFTVTVTGNVANATRSLDLVIDPAVSIKWQATLGGTPSLVGMVRLRVGYGTGTGTFRMESGTISATTQEAIQSDITNSLNIIGGTVSATTGTAINSLSTGTVNISGGTVQATGVNGDAVRNSGSLNISGGEVSATTGRAVLNRSTGAVSISGGTVSATTGTAVTNSDVGKITISGASTIITSANTSATNGTIELLNSGTATAERLVITGGTVENTAVDGGNAIYNASTGAISISGGTISAENGTAVINNRTGTVVIAGASVTASTKIANTNAAGTVVHWNKDAGNTEYHLLSSEDISVLPTTATAMWLNKDGDTGIDYANGANTGFIVIRGIKLVNTLTVNSGTGSGNYAAGELARITANTPPEGKIFDKWTSTDGITFANENSASTTFTMPAKAVTVTATYKIGRAS